MRSYRFIVFKYVILILRKDKYILGRIGLYYWEFGERLDYFRDLESEGKYFYGDKDIIFRETGRSMRYFQGSKKHSPPPGGPQQYKRLNKRHDLSDSLITTARLMWNYTGNWIDRRMDG